ncbi:glycosyltransferase family 2 protein [Cerasicoccus frondis]|uniref:glycosyltransferase family 2 protein n=1 Tax=Cerasicoccus frondis TaxID=490090 RepID=UPI0028527D89|nr:glycosyltransferase family A protein [Cerasicoccus frondis]
MSQPTVTSGIVVYNGEDFLSEAIESVLAQTYVPQEIIVVDDGSTDATPDIACCYPQIRLIQQENQGEGAARNRVIQEASGDYIAFLDHDDCWVPEKLTKQVEALQADPERQFALCRVKIKIEPGTEDTEWALTEKTEQIGAYFPSALLARKSAFNQIGGFRTDVAVGVDIDWFLRSFDHEAPHITLEEPLFIRRIHGSNAMKQHDYMRKSMFLFLRESIKRKKQKDT